MAVAHILRQKGTSVVTVEPGDSVQTIVDMLARHRIGQRHGLRDRRARRERCRRGTRHRRLVVRHGERAGQRDVAGKAMRKLLAEKAGGAGDDDLHEPLLVNQSAMAALASAASRVGATLRT